ncbi:MAG TPA: NAD(P)/FAD-dependent oxidoreductase [Acidobacteriota bacterium]
MVRPQYDAIIIGAGHNGLVAAFYLARAKWKVLVLERRHIVGGACATDEVFPGYRVSVASYLCSLLQERVVADMRLRDFGYQVYPKDPAYFAPFPDGRYLMLWSDSKKNEAEISKFSPKDASVYSRYEWELAKLAQFIEPLLLKTPFNIPPRSPDDLIKAAGFARLALRLSPSRMRLLVKVMTQSVKDFLESWFESEELKVSLATDGVIGTWGGPQSPGTAYVLLHHCMGGVGGVRGLWGFVRGGMGGITQAMASSARALGMEIRTEAPVSKIQIQRGRATGVLMESGESLSAKVVVSNADPRLTFLKLIEPAALPDDFRSEMSSFRAEGTSMKINLALSGLPDFSAFPGQMPGPQHRGTIHICPTVEYIERAWDEAKYGVPSTRPMLEMTIPTLYDDSIAPQGKHLMSIFLQYTPYRLDAEKVWQAYRVRCDGKPLWHALKEVYADRVIDLISEYAPNFKNIIEHRHVLSPLDLEEQFGLTGGNIFHGDMSLDQLFFMRPVAGWAKYRTPIRGLYLCGSGAHPGGGVMGAPGFNAAREVLKDH